MNWVDKIDQMISTTIGFILIISGIVAFGVLLYCALWLIIHHP